MLAGLVGFGAGRWGARPEAESGSEERAQKSAAAPLTVDTPVGPNTLYLVSTSGRISSMRRYRALLRDILGLDVAYIVINDGSGGGGKIDPANFASAVRGLQAVGGAISKV